jgi:hypothetical protein
MFEIVAEMADQLLDDLRVIVLLVAIAIVDALDRHQFADAEISPCRDRAVLRLRTIAPDATSATTNTCSIA